MMYVCWLSVWDTTNPNPHSLLASVNSCVGRSGLYGFNFRLCDMLCLIGLNSLSSSGDQLPFQWLFSCVISLRCFVSIVIVSGFFCRTFEVGVNGYPVLLMVKFTDL